MAATKLILLTGATGYIGGRLLKELEAQGRRVRCLARQPEFLRARVAAGTEVVVGDVLDSASLARAMTDVDTACYLVHSMQRGSDFSEKDRQAARNFGAAARAAGVKRIIYLGGLGDDRQELSEHLRSRHEVGDVLRAGGVPVLEFRASIIIGSGSLSFELIRALVERLPAMIMPRWVSVIAQPMAINDVLSYLVAGLDVPLDVNRILEIGGADRVSYGDIMREYARQRGLKRLMIPVPVLTPKLSSLWLGLVTPLYARVGRILVDSMRHETVVRDRAALALFPIRPTGIREAIAAALRNEDHEFAQTRWSDSLSTANPRRDRGGVRFGNRIVDTRTVTVAATPEAAFAPIERIGGSTGWYFGNGLWQLRGWLDLLSGGVGMRRGRRDARHLLPGDVVDCWRVESVEPPRHLRLAAEMKLPGRAWLEFDVRPATDGVILRQTATFDPVGLWGLIYWYALFSLHELVFRGMIRGLGRAAVHFTADAEQVAGATATGGLKSLLGLVGWLVLCFSVASFGAQFLPGEWYAGLQKPSWNPPGWIFGPVWTALYTMMAVAAWLVWRGGGFKARKLPLGLFLLQLLFNALWSWLFFGRHQPALALVDLVLLWMSLLATTLAFWKVNVIAGRLLVPYLLWVSFAAALNFALWRLNT